MYIYASVYRRIACFTIGMVMDALLIQSFGIWAIVSGALCRLCEFIRLWKLITFYLYVCGKVSVIWCARNEIMWRNGGIAPRILKFSTRWK